MQSSMCWLCTFSNDEVAQIASNLIADNIHVMSPDTIAVQCNMLIESETKRRYGPDVVLEGHTARHIARHIREHMLHANVALANMLRGLIEVSEELKGSIHVSDEESGTTMMDAQRLKNYLAVTNQITSIYKLGDGAKLLFSRSTEQKKD